MKHSTSQIERAKRNAAHEAVRHIKNNSVIGLGSGSTVAYAIEEIGNRIKQEDFHVLGVPTSHQAFMLAIKHKIPVTTLDEQPVLNLTIDGADQIDRKMNLIKGMGAALTREKIVASASKSLIIVADERKKAETLGENGHPVPVEILPFAAKHVMLMIKKIGGNPTLREGKGKVGPVITDNGNFIADTVFGPIPEPAELESKLRSISGVIETGLFVEMADLIYLGKQFEVEKIERKAKRPRS